MIVLMFLGVLLAFQVVGVVYKSFGTLSGDNTRALPVFMGAWAGGLGIVFICVAVIRGFDMSAVTFVAAVVAGMCFAFAGILYIRMLSIGSFIWSALMMNLSNFIPVVFSLVFLGESITTAQIAGVFVIMSILFVMSIRTKTGDKPFTAQWMILAIFMMLGNGGIMSAQKAQAHFSGGTQTIEFLALMFLFTSFFAFMWLVVSGLFNKTVQTRVPVRPLLKLAVVMATMIGVANIINMTLMRYITAAVQFPISVGGGVVLSAIVGVKLYREKPTWRLYLSILMLVGGVVLLGM